MHAAVLKRSSDVRIARHHIDLSARRDPHRFNSVFNDLDQRLINFVLVASSRKELFLQLQVPLRFAGFGLLKLLHNAAYDRIEISSSSRRRFFFGTVESGKVVRDIRSLVGGLFNFLHGLAPGVGRFHLGQNPRGMSHNAGERVIKIQSDRAGQLGGAIDLLLLHQHRFALEVNTRRRSPGTIQLKQKTLLAVAGRGTNINVEHCIETAFGAELQLHAGGGGTFPGGQNLFGGGIIVRRQKRNQRSRITFEHGAEEMNGGLIGAADRTAGFNKQGGPPCVFQDEG